MRGSTQYVPSLILVQCTCRLQYEYAVFINYSYKLRRLVQVYGYIPIPVPTNQYRNATTVTSVFSTEYMRTRTVRVLGTEYWDRNLTVALPQYRSHQIIGSTVIRPYQTGIILVQYVMYLYYIFANIGQ